MVRIYSSNINQHIYFFNETDIHFLSCLLNLIEKWYEKQIEDHTLYWYLTFPLSVTLIPTLYRSLIDRYVQIYQFPDKYKDIESKLHVEKMLYIKYKEMIVFYKELLLNDCALPDYLIEELNNYRFIVRKGLIFKNNEYHYLPYGAYEFPLEQIIVEREKDYIKEKLKNRPWYD